MLKRARLSTIASPKLLNDLFEQKTLIITTTFHLLKQLFFLTKTLHIWAKLCLILYSQNLKLLNQYCHNLREVVHQSRGCSCKVGMSPSRNFPARAELGHFKFRAETELTILTKVKALNSSTSWLVATSMYVLNIQSN